MFDPMGEALQLAVDQLVVVRHGPGDVVGVDEDDVEPLADPPIRALSVFEQVLVVGGILGVVLILEVAKGAVPVAVKVVVVGETELVTIRLSADGPYQLISLFQFLLLAYTELIEEGSVEQLIAVLL